jgi:hypothetical protein
MYEASGFFSVTSASSAFSAALPLAAICASCKPAPLCGDGCGAAAVHSVHGSRAQFCASVRVILCERAGDSGCALSDRLIGHGHAD